MKPVKSACTKFDFLLYSSPVHVAFVHFMHWIIDTKLKPNVDFKNKKTKKKKP